MIRQLNNKLQVSLNASFFYMGLATVVRFLGTILIVFLFSYWLNVSYAHGRFSCSGIFKDESRAFSSIPSLLKQKPTHIQSLEHLESLVHQLLNFNRQLLRNVNEDTFLEIQVRDLRKLADHPSYPYYSADILVKANERSGEFELVFRSNGKVAFVASTWSSEQSSKTGKLSFQAVADIGITQSKIIAVSQNRVVLESLPDQIVLSRSMLDEEMSLWRDGKVEQIKSTENIFGHSTEAEPKSTFALNSFHFNGNAPFRFLVPKSVIVELERQGRLSVNTYEDAANTKGKGMPPEAQTPFGLEVEIVVHGVVGRKAILNYMQNPI